MKSSLEITTAVRFTCRFILCKKNQPCVLQSQPPQQPRVLHNLQGFLLRPGIQQYRSTFPEGIGVDGSGASYPGMDHRWKLFLREMYLGSTLKYQNLIFFFLFNLEITKF